MLKGVILVLVGACSFGILSTFVKLAYADGYSLSDVTGTQAFFGAILLWSCYFVQIKIGKKKSPKSATHWLKLIAAGLFTGLVSMFYYQCVKLVPASLAIILLMQFVWISILLELFIYKKKPSKLQLIAIAIILFGTVLASGFLTSNANQINLEGLFFGMLAALCYAIFLLLNGKLGNDYPPLKKSALMITGACILIFVLLPPTFLVNGALTGSLLKWGIILAVFGTFIPPLCFASGIPKAGLTLSSILSSVELPVAIMVSSLVLKEEVGLIRWVGVTTILGALVIPNLENTKKQNTFK
ncbi:EamA family transporter [Pedobacter insulae]|uniref:Threonine/homoserine efflux transporter RhtA n=1 Tax=Pedobacter insulae TaxID=414048 RepID=A0A1I2TTA1_9SPHI|nr:DMT family transporter [Pedobacter insulae]SFG65706.1 Threonine/homoserine efflux transporter RhtA [Pedobacter insulae]